MLNLTCEDGGVPVEVNQYRERKIEKNVINIITMSLQMNVQLTVTQLLFAMTFFCTFWKWTSFWWIIFSIKMQIICYGYLRTGSQWEIIVMMRLSQTSQIFLVKINVGLQWMAVLSFSGLVIWSPWNGGTTSGWTRDLPHLWSVWERIICSLSGKWYVILFYFFHF